MGINKVINSSKKMMHFVLFEPNIKFSYDLVLGAYESCQYSNLYRFENQSAPIPRANNESDFQQNRIRLRIGTNFFAIFQKSDQEIVLIKTDNYNGSIMQTVSADKAYSLMADIYGVPKLININEDAN